MKKDAAPAFQELVGSDKMIDPASESSVFQ
jgi:hypothetical protein